MSSQELSDYFELLLDKEGSPYFTEGNRNMFLNMGALEYVKRCLPSNEGGVVNLENTEIDFGNISTLVYDISGLVMDSSGVIPLTAIQAKLDTLSGGSDAVMYYLNVSKTIGTSSYPVKYTRHNDWFEFERNSLKRGTATSSRYKTNAINMIIAPVDSASTISLSLLKTPRQIDIGNYVTSDLPEHTHKSIVELAMELASVAVRDGDLAQLNSQQSGK